MAAQFLRGVDLPEGQRAHVKQMCKMFHTSVTEASAAFLAQSGRHNYVTPTSYLELITAFTTLLAAKRAEVMAAKKRSDSIMTGIWAQARVSCQP